MSDTGQGPGWWMASDGKWYPPSATPGAAPTSPSPSPVPAGKPSNPWRRFRGLPLAAQVVSWVVVAFIVIVAASVAGAPKSPQRTIAATQSAPTMAPATTTPAGAPTTAAPAPTTAPTTGAPTTTAAPTTTVPPTTAPPTTPAPTAPPTTAAPVVTAPPTTAAPVAAPTASCYPTASSGNCYRPGQFCPEKDAGMTGVALGGQTIKCEEDNGLRWVAIG